MPSRHQTPEACNSDPFTPLHGQITQADLSRELAELESVGYWSGTGNYSPGIFQVRQRLAEKYAWDCAAQHAPANTQSSSG